MLSLALSWPRGRRQRHYFGPVLLATLPFSGARWVIARAVGRPAPGGGGGGRLCRRATLRRAAGADWLVVTLGCRRDQGHLPQRCRRRCRRRRRRPHHADLPTRKNAPFATHASAAAVARRRSWARGGRRLGKAAPLARKPAARRDHGRLPETEPVQTRNRAKWVPRDRSIVSRCLGQLGPHAQRLRCPTGYGVAGPRGRRVRLGCLDSSEQMCGLVSLGLLCMLARVFAVLPGRKCCLAGLKIVLPN